MSAIGFGGSDGLTVDRLLELGFDVSNSKLLKKVQVTVCSGGSVPRESLGSNTNPKYSVADGLFFSDFDEANDVQGRSQDAHGLGEVARVASRGTQDIPEGVELSYGRRPRGILSARLGLGPGRLRPRCSPVR